MICVCITVYALKIIAHFALKGAVLVPFFWGGVYGWVVPILPEKCTRPSVEGLTPISLRYNFLCLFYEK
jgi:hypothetical protein